MKGILTSAYKNKFLHVSNECVLHSTNTEPMRAWHFLFDSIQLILQVYKAFTICITWT